MGLIKHINVVKALSKDFTFIPPQNEDPRCFKLVLNQTKNDPAGIGPEQNRTWFIPCVCMETVSGRAKQNFIASVASKPFATDCVGACPFGCLYRYYILLPDRDGSMREDQRVKWQGSPDDKPASLRLFRTLSGGKIPHFLTSPEGTRQNILFTYDQLY